MKRDFIMRWIGFLKSRWAIRALGVMSLLMFTCMALASVPRAKSWLSAPLQQELRGLVVDSNNVPLVGVSVVIKGTNVGTQTDKAGTFNFPAITSDAILVFSNTGYQSKEVEVGSHTFISVTLDMNIADLDEVVVVAFGTQKKTDMVGSVTSINPSKLKVPSSNLTTALAGRVSGMIAYQRSGEPGQDNADFFIRGVTTFGYKRDPLILIDGIELTTTDLARLQVDDIASFSILKDATATAVYGSRAANGVILVTTKQGTESKANISFRVENAISTPTRNIELADPVTYMRLNNEAIATRNPLAQLLYSDEKIANTEAGSNPVVYPANDWREIMFKDYTMNQRVNLNVRGGGKVAKYFVSGSYNKDNGLMKVDKRNNFNNNIDLKSYSLRTNVNINLSPSTELNARLSGSFDDYTGPIDGGADMYDKVMHANPALFPAYYPVDAEHGHVNHIMFGNFDSGQYINPYAEMTKGYRDYSRSLMQAQFEVKQDLSGITQGLNVRAMLNTNRTSFFGVSRFYNPYFYTLLGYDKLNDNYYIQNINEDSATEYLGYREDDKLVSSSFYLESALNYDRLFGKHGVSALVVYMMQQKLNANAGNLQLSLPFRNMGISGRTTYDFDKRYFAEFTFGFNGSERFHESKRYGFFPSVGLAWTLSNETFFEPLKSVFTNARVRATYGIIGNDAIGADIDRFFYLSNVNMNDGNRGATFGRDPGSNFHLNGVSVSRYANQEITWETAIKRNIALELDLYKDLNIILEYYAEERNNILMTRAAIPWSMGLAADIRANVGKASGSGVDASFNYTKSFLNGAWISAMGNFTYASSKYEFYEEPQYEEWYRGRKGHSVNQEFGYIAERLFVDDYDAQNSPYQNFGEYGGGDIKYMDVNGDGQITEADRVPIGNPILPEIVYGFGFSGGFRNFDISAFFQGLANESFWINASNTSPFNNNTALLKAYADSYWSEDNRDIYALWPRLSPTVNNNNTQTSTWFMRDGTFLRLKQLEIGYSLPERIADRIGANNLRIYLNGTNLLTFSKFDLWDIEMGGNGIGYPIQRVFNIGINLDF